jgi:hypothetical protein
VVRTQAILIAWIVTASVSLSDVARAQSPFGDRDYTPRQLAPGVVTSIEPVATEEDSADGPREFSELLGVMPPLAWQPTDSPETQTLEQMARQVTFRRQIWTLEFGFKPLRIIRVGGRDVWYLLYFVRNHGRHHYPEPQSDATYQLKPVNHPIRFIPQFVLQSRELNKAYRDQVLPDVVAAIEQRERPPGPLHDSSNIGLVRIPVSTELEDHSVWGVATWPGVDPRSDFLSVYVQGLTNAFRWQAPQQPGRDLAQNRESILFKTLQLNFWRAGDAVNLRDEEIHYGIPLEPEDPQRQQQILDIYGLSEPVAYQWVFRPSGGP